MAKEEVLEFEGEVIDVLPKGLFKVRLDNDYEIMAHLSGKMRRFRIKIVLGDRIKADVSPYDITKGRITYRFK